MIRVLGAGDEAALERFLLQHADSSMFLRANARAAGLVDHGQPLQATYAADVRPDGIADVAAHCWNGMLIVQAPGDLEPVARAAVRGSGRPVLGIAGPHAQVVEAAKVFGIEGRGEREVLFVLDLERLRVPSALANGEVLCRRPRSEELELLTDWRCDYLVEGGLAQPGPALRGLASAGVALMHVQRSDWVLEKDGELVSYSGFNARVPDMVQIGGVWTPPPLRSRGYARSAVAGSLIEARAAGVRRAVLFTPEKNVAAQRSYVALGFGPAGDYGLAIPKRG